MSDSAPPGWGKLNEGQRFDIIAVDIDRALAHARMTSYEQMLMQYARERCWGTALRDKRRGDPWPDPAPFELSLHALADEFGCPRQRLQEAKRTLLADRMLTEEDGMFLINKNVDEWGRLGPESLAYARAGQAEGGARKSVPPGGTEKRAGGGTEKRAGGGTEKRAGGGTEFRSRGARNSVLGGHGIPCPPLIEEAPARSGRLKKSEEEAATAAAPGGDAAAAVELARELFGDEAADAVAAEAWKLHERTDGRWDKVCAALREAAAKRGGVSNLIGFLIRVAPTARAAAAVSVQGRRKPRDDFDAEAWARLMEDTER